MRVVTPRRALLSFGAGERRPISLQPAATKPKASHARPKIIFQTLKSRGSGTGITYWLKWADCPERAYLDEKAADNAEPTSMESEATRTGTIVHAFLELYYKRGAGLPFEAGAVRFQSERGDPFDVAEESRIHAEQIFRAYRVQFPANELGKIVAIEQLVPTPGDKSMAARIEKAVGISPYTMKPDLVIKLTKKDCERLKKTRHVDLKPGLYLLDHKTDNARWGIDRYLNSHQFTAYFLAWEAAFGVKLMGVLVNILYTTKQPDFLTLFIPPPTQVAINSLHHQLASIVFLREHMPRWKNTNRCFFPKPCLFHTNQLCRKY